MEFVQKYPMLFAAPEYIMYTLAFGNAAYFIWLALTM